MKNYFKNLAYYFPSGKFWATKNKKEIKNNFIDIGKFIDDKL